MRVRLSAHVRSITATGRIPGYWNWSVNVELDITDLIDQVEPADYSASRVELGDDAGRITWNNATRDALELFGAQFDREAFDSYFSHFGAWDDAELAAHADSESAALMLQFISAELRECDFSDWPEPFTPEWWSEYESESERGTVSGSLFRSDNGRVYFYAGE